MFRKFRRTSQDVVVPLPSPAERSAAVRDGLTPPVRRVPRDPQWPAAAAALRVLPRTIGTGLQAQVPGMPPVVAVARDVVIDPLGLSVEGTDVLLVTDQDSRVVLTLRATPDGAAALVSALMPIATRSARVSDTLLPAAEREALR